MWDRAATEKLSENISDDGKVTTADHIGLIISDNVELVDAGTVSDSFTLFHCR